MSNDRGFTLLEVLVAFTVLALVLGAAYGAMSSGLRATTRSGEALTALARAESVLARVGPEIPLQTGAWSEREGDWIAEVDITAHGSAQTWQSVGQQPLLVSVAIRDGSGGQAVRLSTLRLADTP